VEEPPLKLFEVPNNTRIKLVATGELLTFEHLDGMYSFCLTDSGEVVHQAAWSEVEIITESS
jgi:hypothetical protein